MRARKFEVDKVKEMIDKYMGFRDEYKVNTIMSYKFERKKEMFPFYPRGYIGVDKIGRPVYMERCGSINATKCFEIASDEEFFMDFV